MEGVPPKDQAEWRAKKEAELGIRSQDLAHAQMANRRPRIFKGVLSEADLQAALEQHKRLMSGGKLGMPPPIPGLVMPPGGQQFMPFPGGPPPGMGFPPQGCVLLRAHHGAAQHR